MRKMNIDTCMYIAVSIITIWYAGVLSHMQSVSFCSFQFHPSVKRSYHNYLRDFGFLILTPEPEHYNLLIDKNISTLTLRIYIANQKTLAMKNIMRGSLFYALHVRY